MQAVVVNNQVDFTKLQTLNSQLNSFNQTESFLPGKKSFDDMVQEARQVNEKPVEINVEKTKDKVPEEKKEVNSEEKTEISDNRKEKVLEKEKEPDLKEKKSVDFVKVEEKKVEKCEKNLVSKLINQEKTENSSKIDGEKKISSSKLKEILENVRKTSADEEEKAALTEKDIELLLDNDQISLLQVVNMSEEIIQSQNENLAFAEELPDWSEINIEDNSDVSNAKSKIFAFDKEGKIIVKDLRSEEFEYHSEEKNPKSELKISQVRFDGNNSAEMTMDLAQNVQQNLVSSSDQTASANGSNFQAMLTNQIQENAGEIVKAGNIILKDNDIGQIKLILHPEKLGNVKIDLQLNDKSITGRIVVASQEAFNAFKDSADSLKQAFLESGFDNAGLELSFANQNQGGNQEAGQDSKEALSRFAMKKAFGEVDESLNFNFEDENLENSLLNSVNIVA